MNGTVITGMGIWSCIGQNRASVAESLRAGKSGIGLDHHRTELGYQSPLTGIVPFPDLSDSDLSNSQRQSLSEPSAYAYMAVREALEMSGLRDLSRCGLIVSNDSTAAEFHRAEDIMRSRQDSRLLGAYQVFRSLNSTVSLTLSSIFGIGGLSVTVSAACAGGGHAVGIAHSLIQSGVLDCCIVVGAQECNPFAFLGVDGMGLISRRSDNPAAASRPFDRLRDGLVPSGGAAALILESESRARARLGSIIGYSFSTSPSYITPKSNVILDTMTCAWQSCRISVLYQGLSLIMSHATSTREGDTAEAQAIRQFLDSEHFFGRTKPYIAATKSLTGHECWMSGVSQIIYAILMKQGGFVLPHAYLTNPDSAIEGLNIPLTDVEATITNVLCNSFGFGGTNACIVLGD